MNYSKREDIQVDGHTVVELDIGDLVAVRHSTASERGMVTIRVHAHVVDVGGEELVDHNGHPIVREFSKAVPVSLIGENGAVEIARDCIKVLLGELPEDPTMASEHMARWREDLSIRAAILGERMTTEINNANLL